MNARITTPTFGIEETPEGYLRFWARIADPEYVMHYADRGVSMTVSSKVLCEDPWLDDLVGKPILINHVYDAAGQPVPITIDDLPAVRVGVVLETTAHDGEPYARCQVDMPKGAAWVRERETTGIGVSPSYFANAEHTTPGKMEQVKRTASNHLALTDTQRGGPRVHALIHLGDETLTGLRIALTPAAPDLTKAIEKIAEVVPGFAAAPVLEIDLLTGIPADKAEAAAAEIERAAEVCRARKEGPPVSHFHSVMADPPAADGSRAIVLLGYASPYLYEAAERLLGPDRPISAMPCPSRLKLGSTPEPLTTAQIEAIGSLRFNGDDEIAIACATLSLLGGDAPVAVILADEEPNPDTLPQPKEGRVPVPEEFQSAVAAFPEDMRPAVDGLLMAIVEYAAKMKSAEPVADMGKDKMLADEAVKPLKAQIATLNAEKAQLLADAHAVKIAAARPAVLRLAKAQGFVLADEASAADVVSAAEKIALKAGIAVKGDAALAAVQLADAQPPTERTRLSDPPKAETPSKPLNVEC